MNISVHKDERGARIVPPLGTRDREGPRPLLSLLTTLPWVFPWILITFFSIAYIRLALLNHLQFRTGLDLGIYGQALYHLSHFRLPYSTFKEQVLWGDHAHFILVFLAPLYRIFPDVRLLLITQALAVTTAGWALYRVARDTVRSTFFALAALVSYLSFIGIQHALDFDFHPSVLTGAAMLWVIYALHVRNFPLYWMALGLGLITREDAGPIFFMLGAYLLFRRRQALAVATMLVSAVYFFTVGYGIMPIWTPGHIPLAYLDVPDKNPIRILRDTVARPITTVQNMVDTPEKVHTIKTLFSSFAFLPLFSPFTYLTSLPIFLSRFLSPNEYRWFIQSHSNANILPILAYGTVLGAAAVLRLAQRAGERIRHVAAMGLSALLLVSAYLTAWRDPDAPLRKLTRPEFTDEASLPRTGIAAFQLVKAIIPPEGGVSASSGFVPHLSGRKYVVNFPEIKDHTHWIVLSQEFNTWPLRKGETDTAIAELIRNPDYELLWQEYGIYLFKKKRFSSQPDSGATTVSEPPP